MILYSLKKLLSAKAKGQRGFTLIEMIVVLGIIVLLAAVVVPNITRFAGKGDEGAMEKERKSVQTAMDAMMTEKVLASVAGLASSDDSVGNWTALPGGPGALPLNDYLQRPITIYFYCYDSSGQITRQDETATACP